MIKEDPNHPLLNPLLREGDLGFKGARVFLWYGGREMLLTQFIAMEARLVREGALVKQHFSPSEIHDGPIFQEFAYKDLLREFSSILSWSGYRSLEQQEGELVKRYSLEGNI